MWYHVPKNAEQEKNGAESDRKATQKTTQQEKNTQTRTKKKNNDSPKPHAAQSKI